MLKYIKIYEDFDLDKFLEDPDSEFHDDSDPEIQEGDWVISYRGLGQVLSINGDTAKVQLISGARAIFNVPVGMLTKTTKEEAIERAKNLPNTKKELSGMISELDKILSASVSIDDETGEEMFTGSIDKSIEYLEDFLVEIISLRNKDPFCPYYTEYSSFISRVSEICFLILDNIKSQMEFTNRKISSREMSELQTKKKKMEAIQDKYFEISD